MPIIGSVFRVEDIGVCWVFLLKEEPANISACRFSWCLKVRGVVADSKHRLTTGLVLKASMAILSVVWWIVTSLESSVGFANVYMKEA